jgi:hypothetical protein
VLCGRKLVATKPGVVEIIASRDFFIGVASPTRSASGSYDLHSPALQRGAAAKYLADDADLRRNAAGRHARSAESRRAVYFVNVAATMISSEPPASLGAQSPWNSHEVGA